MSTWWGEHLSTGWRLAQLETFRTYFTAPIPPVKTLLLACPPLLRAWPWTVVEERSGNACKGDAREVCVAPGRVGRQCGPSITTATAYQILLPGEGCSHITLTIYSKMLCSTLSVTFHCWNYIMYRPKSWDLGKDTQSWEGPRKTNSFPLLFSPARYR